MQDLSQSVEQNPGTTTAVATTGAIVAALPVLVGLNSLSDIFLLLRGGFGALAGLFVKRKRKDWGRGL